MQMSITRLADLLQDHYVYLPYFVAVAAFPLLQGSVRTAITQVFKCITSELHKHLFSITALSTSSLTAICCTSVFIRPESIDAILQLSWICGVSWGNVLQGTYESLQHGRHLRPNAIPA